MNAPHTPALPTTLDALAARPLWVAWQTERREPGKPPTKVPYAPRQTGKARADEAATWGTRPEAEARAARLPRPCGTGGVGLELADIGDGRRLGGVDLDTCHEAGGAIESWAAEVVERFASYTEVSPSGSGVKVFFTYTATDLPALRAAMGTDHGKQWKNGSGAHPPAIELHVGNRYFAVTGDHLAGTPAELMPVGAETLTWLIREAGPSFARRKAEAGAGKAGDGSDDAPDLAARIEAQAGRWPTLARRWGGDWGGLQDQSRSGRAMSLGALLKLAGFNRADTAEALTLHPDTKEWADAATARDFDRIFDKAGRGQRNDDPAPWPTLQLDLAAADPLPPPLLPVRAVFSPGWASWIEAAAESKGAPPDYVALALLSVAGALIGNSRWANPWEGWQEPPIAPAALVGNPSAGKSPALDAQVSPLQEIEAADNEDWQERKRKHLTAKTAAAERRELWEKEVKTAVKDRYPPPTMPADADDPEPPQRRRIFSTDPTVAKAERLSAANPRGLLLLRDELAGWIAGMDRFNNGAGSDRAFWLQAYGGRPWTPDRVKDGDAEVSVPNLTWSIVGGIQPDRLASLLLTGDDDGLAARFLYTWPAPQRPRRPRDGLAVACAREWLARLRVLPWTPPAPLLVPFAPGAQAALQEWREEVARMEEGTAGLFLSWLGKLPGFAVRLALIFAHLAWCEHGRGDPPGEVQEADMLRAVTFLADYAVPMARRCFGEAALPQSERDARRLARWLLRRQPVPATLNVRELRRMQDGPGISTPDRVRAALEELAGLGWVRQADPNRAGMGGRSRDDWTVNPALVGGAHGMA
jgi:hypothetical protein